ncbi:MarR family winged helix-turn-helix transcriptional regulator [Streptomyces sp. NBC_01136]|uniref:MarR family winged helix-turn-helix transcriptional regulator n=1 Tax=unclassified Streptomyces TaxID=2593676 RepID=UPI003248644F|nr:MarR family winged helix-turn-helix transcriptional regulator [Streptomyces sp. NBC_01136]
MEAWDWGRVAASEPLSCEEERLWRSLQRLLVALPRALDEDLLRCTGLSLTQYIVLMHLSEVAGNQLRMTDLAAATALSASRITRVVEDLQADDLVVKRRHATDARGYVAVITEEGRRRLRGAYPAHLVSARRRVMDQLDPAIVGPLAAQVESVADRLCAAPQAAREPEV